MAANGTGFVRKAVGPGILLVLLTVLISGVSNFVNFYAVGLSTGSDAFVAVRNLVVAGVLGIMALLLVALRAPAVRSRLTRVDWAKLGAIGILGGGIPFLLFFRGLQMAGASGAATATFGYRALFLMAAVFGVVFLRERLSPRIALAAALLLAGNALLLSFTAPIWTDGTAYVLLATALWASEYTLSKHALRNLSPGTVALARMGFGGAFILGYVGVSGQMGSVLTLSGPQWGWVLLSAILLVGFVTTWYAGLKSLDLSVATAVLVLAFPITWVLGALAGTSPVTLPQAAGVVAIVLGVVAAIGLTSLRDTWETVAAWIRARVYRAE